jgi:hypothetical protein
MENTAWVSLVVETTSWNQFNAPTVDVYDGAGVYDTTDFYDGYDPTINNAINDTVWS